MQRKKSKDPGSMSNKKPRSFLHLPAIHPRLFPLCPSYNSTTFSLQDDEEVHLISWGLQFLKLRTSHLFLHLKKLNNLQCPLSLAGFSIPAKSRHGVFYIPLLFL